MDPELQKQLAEMLRALMANAQDATAWARGEIPLLIKEKIAFGRAWETTAFVILVGALIGLVKFWKVVLKHKYEDDDNKIGARVVTSAVTVILGILTFVELHDAMLVWFAPRLYIVEWLIELAKPARR